MIMGTWGGVLDETKHFVEESATVRDIPDKALLDGYEIKDLPQYRDEIVIYGGILYEFYGHVLLETSTRLWYYFKHNPHNYRVVFDVVPRARGKFKEFFELWDIPYDNNTFITEPTQYKKVIIPEQSSVYATSWHKDFVVPFEYMKSKVEAEKHDKIYFTRTKLLRNPVWGEEQIEKIFASNGFKVFAPEQLTLRKQIALMKGCQEFASLNGSLNHNLLFSNDNIKVIQLNRDFEPDFCHWVVDQVQQHQCFIVDVSLSPLPVSHVHGPWIAGITEELKTFFVEHNFKLPKKLKVNIVKSMHIVLFFMCWYSHNKNFKIDGKEVMLCQSRYKIVSSHKILKKISKILAKFTFGKIKRNLEMKSKTF